MPLESIDWEKAAFTDVCALAERTYLAKRAGEKDDAPSGQPPATGATGGGTPSGGGAPAGSAPPGGGAKPNTPTDTDWKTHAGIGLLGAGVGGLAGLVRSSTRKNKRPLLDTLIGAGLGGALGAGGSYGLQLYNQQKETGKNLGGNSDSQKAFEDYKGSLDKLRSRTWKNPESQKKFIELTNQLKVEKDPEKQKEIHAAMKGLTGDIDRWNRNVKDDDSKLWGATKSVGGHAGEVWDRLVSNPTQTAGLAGLGAGGLKVINNIRDRAHERQMFHDAVMNPGKAKGLFDSLQAMTRTDPNSGKKVPVYDMDAVKARMANQSNWYRPNGRTLMSWLARSNDTPLPGLGGLTRNNVSELANAQGAKTKPSNLGRGSGYFAAATAVPLVAGLVQNLIGPNAHGEQDADEVARSLIAYNKAMPSR